MANERYGNNYLVALGVQTDYDTENPEYTVVLPDKVEMKKTIAAIDISQKTGVLSKKNTEKLAGYTGGEVTLSGQLVPGSGVTNLHGILLEAMFTGTSAFVVPGVGTTPNSYSIYQFFNSDDKGNIGLSCVMESFNITGSSGGGIDYTANFRPKAVTYEANLASGDHIVENASDEDPFVNIPDITPAIFADTTLTTMGGATAITTLNSFSIDLTNTFADDASIYQNSNTKSQEILTGFEGSFTAEWNYNKSATGDPAISADLMADALTSIVLAITDGTNIWTFTLYGKVTEYSFADPDKGIFTSSMTMELMSDDSHIPVSIAISQ